MKKYFPALIILVLSFLLSKPVHPKIGDNAPPISLFKLETNKYFRSKELLGNKNLVISFFATWCVPCKKEIPELIKLSKQFKEDFEFVLIDVNEKKEKVKKHVEDNNITLQVILDKYGRVFKSYGRETLPLLVVIDKQGKISYYHTGYQKGDEKKLSKHLKSL